jgi:hypothetical protein
LTDPKGSVLHQQALTVMGLFTGLTLTALVLILNSPRSFHVALGPLTGPQYFQVVTTYVAVESAMSSVAMVIYLEVAGGLARVYSFTDKLGTTLFLASAFGFMGILPLLLVPFTPGGAGLVLLFIVVLLTLYLLGRRLPVTDPRALAPRPAPEAESGSERP